MSTGTLPLLFPGDESTRTGQSVSPATVKVDFGPNYPFAIPSELPAGIYSTSETKILQRHEIQSGAAAVSFDAVTSSDYVITLGRIEELRREENDDDRPSDHAYDGALKVLLEAARELSLKFPRASASVGPNRGLRITWSYGPREVRLIFGGSASNKSYIYGESGSKHGVEYVVDGRHLAEHLRWALRQD
jgi:hypothetical protein